MLCSVLVLALAVRSSKAQTPAPAPVQTPVQTTDADSAEASSQPGSPQVRDEVELAVIKLGPGGRARAGEWTGILVEYRDSALNQREIVLRVTGIDRDGDPPAYQRAVVGDPERARSVWLYAPMPYPSQVDRIVVTAHEAIEDGAATDGFRAGRVLGRAAIRTNALIQGESPFMGVIGTRDAGLRQYGVALKLGVSHLPLGHTSSEVVTGLTIRDLPDRWQGLKAFEVLVWSRGGPDTDPNALDADRARAIKEWVTRGGHLVVLLPPVGQEWTAGGGRNPLADILPAVRVDRREGVPLEPYRPLLTLRGSTRLPREAIVHTLEPAPDASVLDASPILAGPDGVPVATRRIVGQGMVTVIGLDIAAENLQTLDVLDAETIWHRVLGKRYALDTFDQVKAADVNLSSAIQRRAVHDLDDSFERAIDFTGDAGKGVLLGLGVFAVYWLVAGPLGFFLLTKAGYRNHAWLGYIATGAVFTAIAWAGATLLRPNTVRAIHLTFLDGVYGTEHQSAASWMSVLVPSYGEAQFALGEPASQDLLTPWVPPPPAIAGGGFPDNRGYTISARSPSNITLPVRSTIKQLSAHWSGPPIANLPRPVRQPGELQDAALVLTDPDAGLVSGEITHDLPGSLRDVLVVVVTGESDLVVPQNITPLWMPARVYIDRLPGDAWAPGDRLDLAAVTSEASPGMRTGIGWLSRASMYGRNRSAVPGEQVGAGDANDHYEALSFLSMLAVPRFLENSSGMRESPSATVRTAHGLDLSRWFTQPCVIIIGHLEQTEGDLPIPLTVNGRPVPAKGQTVVRWVYPLTPAPPAYRSDRLEDPSPTPSPPESQPAPQQG